MDLTEKILILDGAMGTMIQRLNLSEEDFSRGMAPMGNKPLKGCNDVLCITCPECIKSIHTAYLEAGADIISTNSFNANRFSLGDYGLADRVTEINTAAARIARQAADEFIAAHPGRKVYVAGSVGPTNRTASMSPDVNDPARRDATYGILRATYREQIHALVTSGADIILIETVFDTLNAKAALHAAEDVRSAGAPEFSIMVSVTVTEKGARTFSGQTLDAFIASVSHAPIMSLGLNCSFGPEEMLPVLRRLARISPFPVSAHPNAGLPDESGHYQATPEIFANAISRFVSEGLVNIVGGCCGTTPEHIRLLPALIKGATPHKPAASNQSLTLSGLSPLTLGSPLRFLSIGERCNVAGSRKFLRLIKEKNYDEALNIALRQIHDGAHVIDINMDDPMIDAPVEMSRFLNLIAAEPDIADVPVMIDSSDWATVRAGLEAVQGKAVVNSISLKEGPGRFIEKAREIHSYGAAMVVMAFDENGQADTFARKTEVCSRAYSLLVNEAGIPPHDIIFDPNILTVATGIEAHDRYALDFIEATRWIKGNLPGAKVSGGVSNLSFAFRGNNPLRQAIHSVFLHHATLAGLDMAILNPAAIPPIDSIDPTLRRLIEDVLLCRGNSGVAVERLLDYASNIDNSVTAAHGPTAETDRTKLDLTTRITEAITGGTAEFLQTDLAEALNAYPDAAAIINGPLMEGMNRVGELFSQGKMFLPQVVKSARTMKKAVEILTPALDSAGSKESEAGVILFATVRGDVHDIGKNIVSIVLACNNFRVIDLGVMVEPDAIIEAARTHHPDFICLSGLITPSLAEMAIVIKMVEESGLRIPVMVGGAATSRLHTALKLAPLAQSPVIYASDAAQNPIMAAQYLNPSTRTDFIENIEAEYTRLRQSHTKASLIPFAEAIDRRLRLPWQAYSPVAPACGTERHVITLDPLQIKPFLNRKALLKAWGLANRPGSDEARELLEDAVRMFERLVQTVPNFCRAALRIVPACSEDNSLILDGKPWPMLRTQRIVEGHTLSLADYVMPAGESLADYVGIFAVNGAYNLDKLKKSLEKDFYRSLLLAMLCDRIAEAGAELLHMMVRRQLWGYTPDETLSVRDMMQGHYRGIRPAVGFPSIPDQLMNKLLDRELNLADIGITLTENGAMQPASSVSGLMIAHPDARYFTVGPVSEDQLASYARQRGIPVSRLHDILPQ